jgi:hypothetical protein
MRLIAKDDIPPLHFLGWVIVVHVVIWMDFFLPVTWSSQSAEMEVNRVRLGIKKDPPIRSELSAVRGAACPRAHPESFGVHFYLYFIFSSIRRNSPCCLSLPSPDWGDIKRANDSADRLPAAGMDGRGTPPFLIVPFVLLQPPPIFCQHKTDNNNI